jgi:hypothetical protein
MSHSVGLFYTSSATLRAENIFVQAGLTVELIPTPRELPSDCGIALRFEITLRQQVENLLARIKIVGI